MELNKNNGRKLFKNAVVIQSLFVISIILLSCYLDNIPRFEVINTADK